MREILFRGKRVDNGEWVVGGYHKHISRQMCPIGDELKESDIKHLIIQSGFADWNMPKPLQAIEVIPETVGQDTGLKDKNGVRIFGGDILHKDGYWKWFVDFARGSFIGLPTNPTQRANARGYALDLDRVDDWEVIGNIHDNPELLEEVQDEN